MDFVILNSPNSKYIGENSKKNIVFGIKINKNGSKYIGNWKDKLQIGLGIMKNINVIRVINFLKPTRQLSIKIICIVVIVMVKNLGLKSMLMMTSLKQSLTDNNMKQMKHLVIIFKVFFKQSLSKVQVVLIISDC